MGEQRVSSEGTATTLEAPTTVDHPDTWRWWSATSMEKPREGDSWLEWQLRNLEDDTIIEWYGNVLSVLYGECMNPPMEEHHLSAMRVLMTGGNHQITVCDQARLAELFLHPREEDELEDREKLAQAVLSALQWHRSGFSEGKYDGIGVGGFYDSLGVGVSITREKVVRFHAKLSKGDKEALNKAITDTVEVLAKRWRGTFNEKSLERQAVNLLGLTHPIASDEYVEESIQDARVRALVAFSGRLRYSLAAEGEQAMQLGFSRELNAEEILLLRRFSKRLRQEMGKPGWKDSLIPFSLVVGTLTPERLLSFAAIVVEYNWEWAMAAMEWDVPADVI